MRGHLSACAWKPSLWRVWRRMWSRWILLGLVKVGRRSGCFCSFLLQRATFFHGVPHFSLTKKYWVASDNKAHKRPVVTHGVHWVHLMIQLIWYLRWPQNRRVVCVEPGSNPPMSQLQNGCDRQTTNRDLLIRLRWRCRLFFYCFLHMSDIISSNEIFQLHHSHHGNWAPRNPIILTLFYITFLSQPAIPVEQLFSCSE